MTSSLDVLGRLAGATNPLRPSTALKWQISLCCGRQLVNSSHVAHGHRAGCWTKTILASRFRTGDLVHCRVEFGYRPATHASPTRSRLRRHSPARSSPSRRTMIETCRLVRRPACAVAPGHDVARRDPVIIGAARVRQARFVVALETAFGARRGQRLDAFGPRFGAQARHSAMTIRSPRPRRGAQPQHDPRRQPRESAHHRETVQPGICGLRRRRNERCRSRRTRDAATVVEVGFVAGYLACE